VLIVRWRAENHRLTENFSWNQGCCIHAVLPDNQETFKVPGQWIDWLRLVICGAILKVDRPDEESAYGENDGQLMGKVTETHGS
jgi:hypothetical protein